MTMALPVLTPWSDGALRGVLYVFENAGDVLPLHDHEPEAAHITVITRGEFTVTGPGASGEPGWSKVRGPGPILSFDAGQPHEFAANVPDSRILNIVKGAL